MPRFGLATKITLPFVALFAVLMVGLGWVLVQDTFNELEQRVEQQQRFLLSLATHRHFQLPLTEHTLRGIRDTVAGIDEGETLSEFVVFRPKQPAVTTLDVNDPAGRTLVEELRAAAGDPKALPGLDNVDKISATRLTLASTPYLVLYASTLRGQCFLLYPQSALDAAKDRALWRFAWLGLLGIGLAALLGRLVAQWVSRPVRRLARNAGRLAAGGLSETLETEGADGAGAGTPRDEIGRLGEAFRTMVASLRQSQEDLIKTERLAVTGKLAASVAHEIRNPLTSLRMTVEMLAAKGGDESTQEAYRIVLGELDRLALAVEELLTFARPRPPKREPTDLNRLSADTLAFLKNQLDHARVKSELESDSGLPADLALDPAKIRQLLVNLILNAMQAIVRNGQVTVRTKWDAAARKVTLEVADTGPGVPAEVREKIFELFVSTKPGGGGLGLAIAKQVVEEHGGTIAFETSERGTTFRIELPATPELSAMPEAARVAE